MKRVNRMLSLWVLSLPALGISFAASAAGPPQNPVVRWQEIKAAWLDYDEHPTEPLELRVMGLLPKAPGFRTLKPEHERDARDAILRHQSRFLKRVHLARPTAVRLAFQLFAIADNEWAQELREEIGLSILDNAEVFLREYTRNGAMAGPVEALVVPERRSVRDLQLREHEFWEVTDPSLRALRDQCVRALVQARQAIKP